MKKSVYLSGIASTILMLLGCMFKIMHWPGSSAMLILSVFLFCFFFLPVALINSYKNEESTKYKMLHVITYIVFSICVMGVLFKVLHWPGAGIFLMIGLPLPFVVFLPAYLYYTKDDKNASSTNFLGVMFGLIFLAVFSVLLALTISKQVLRNAITRVYNQEQASSFSQSIATNFNTNPEVKKSSDELCVYIDNLKCELLAATENTLCVDNKMQINNLWEMREVDNKVIPTSVLFGNGDKNKLEDLKLKIKGYHESLIASGKMDPELTNLTNSLFDVESSREMDNGGNPNELTWEQREFSNKQLIFVLDGLSQIQSNVRLVEYEFLASVK